MGSDADAADRVPPPPGASGPEIGQAAPRAQPGVGAGSFTLTDREIEALSWVARGKSSTDIAVIMSVSERTVNFHIQNVIRKLGVATRVQAAIRCALLGLIDI